jgi:Family of unknown function (DUF6064)
MSVVVMSEWWSYRLSDFLLFAPATYHRLFELYNAAMWPLHLAALALGLLIAALAWAGLPPALRCVLLAAAWFWVAWAFHLGQYASINWAATWFAAAFVLQGLLLLLAAAAAGWQQAPFPDTPPFVPRSDMAGLGLLVFALAVQPALGLLFGRGWAQSQWFALAPDPTAIGSLGVLLGLPPARRRWLAALLWTVPLLWCVVAGLTLWAMDSADAWLPPAVALFAAGRAWRRERTRP